MMYASLDRIDLVIQRDDGRKEYWQTDHRTAEEVERQRPLSILFALVRIMNPRRGDEADPVMVYSAAHPPPEFLLAALRAAGALLTVGDALEPKPVPGPAAAAEARGTFLGRAFGAARGLLGGEGATRGEAGGTASLDEIIQGAFSSLAHEVAARHGVPLTFNGLQAVETALAETSPSCEEDETAYWTAVLELGALGGELIRATNGGRWVQVDKGSLPFALSTRFRGGPATVNPLGKAIKLFADGAGESVAGLVRVTRDNP
jgi:hypothetical protein